ncbi:MAG: glycosyltransferase family 2 protein [Gemmatimonadota bacterium]|nr:glycosyltransferase family 2 protein [Gemmatimonadota bacterium]
MLAAPSVWIVIPALNEARTIGEVVAPLRAHGWRVLVIDDGSHDTTAAAAQAGGAVVLRHAINLGQGAGLRTGFAFVRAQPEARIVVTYDADGQHQPESVATLLGALEQSGADVALGSRFLDPAASREIPTSRRALLRLATLFTRATTGLRLTDAHNGLRALTVEAATRLRLTHNRMAHASEILSEIARLGLRYVEAPVTIRYTDYSMAKGQRPLDAIAILWDIFTAGLR